MKVLSKPSVVATDATPGTPLRIHVLKWVRVGVTVGLLAWLGWTIDWSQLAALTRSLRAGWIACAATLLIINGLISVAKWNVLLEAKGIFFSFLH